MRSELYVTHPFKAPKNVNGIIEPKRYRRIRALWWMVENTMRVRSRFLPALHLRQRKLIRRIYRRLNGSTSRALASRLHRSKKQGKTRRHWWGRKRRQSASVLHADSCQNCQNWSVCIQFVKLIRYVGRECFPSLREKSAIIHQERE